MSIVPANSYACRSIHFDKRTAPIARTVFPFEVALGGWPTLPHHKRDGFDSVGAASFPDFGKGAEVESAPALLFANLHFDFGIGANDCSSHRRASSPAHPLPNAQRVRHPPRQMQLQKQNKVNSCVYYLRGKLRLCGALYVKAFQQLKAVPPAHISGARAFQLNHDLKGAPPAQPDSNAQKFSRPPLQLISPSAPFLREDGYRHPRRSELDAQHRLASWLRPR